MADKKRQWSDLSAKEKAEAVKTEPNEAYFWTGMTKGEDGNIYAGEENAAAIAELNGGKTLEMKLNENNVDTESMSGAEWNEASEMFAHGASGEVHCIKGEEVRDNSVYNTTERDALLNNPEVSEVRYVDAVNGEETGEVESAEQSAESAKFNESAKTAAQAENAEGAANFNESAKNAAQGNAAAEEQAQNQSQSAGRTR